MRRGENRGKCDRTPIAVRCENREDRKEVHVVIDLPCPGPGINQEGRETRQHAGVRQPRRKTDGIEAPTDRRDDAENRCRQRNTRNVDVIEPRYHSKERHMDPSVTNEKTAYVLTERVESRLFHVSP